MDLNKQYKLVLYISILLCIVSMSLSFVNFSNWGTIDFDYEAAGLSFSLDSLRSFKLPLWLHYYRGGINFWGLPLGVGVSVFTPLIIFFSNITAYKLTYIFSYLIGTFGAYLCGRELKLSPSALLIFVTVSTLNSMFMLVISGGMLSFSYYIMFPLLLWFWLKGTRLTLFLGIPLFIASFAMTGTMHALVISLVGLGVWFLFHLNKSNFYQIRYFIIAIFLGIGLSSFKLVPGLMYMQDSPRVVETAVGGFSAQSFLYSLVYPKQQIYKHKNEYNAHVDFSKIFSGDKTSAVKGFSYWWDENGMYVGILPLLLFCAGLFNRKKFSLPILFYTLFFMLLCFGSRLPYGPWNMLDNFFPFNSVRFPTRFRFLFMFGFAYFCSIGWEFVLEYIKQFKREKLNKVFFYFSLLLIIAPIVGVSNYASSFSFPYQAVKIEKGEFKTLEKCPINITYMETTDIGIFPCYLAGLSAVLSDESDEISPIKSGVIPRESKYYKGEAYSLEDHDDSNYKLEFLLNKIKVKFNEASKSKTVIINQNYNEGWTSNDGVVFNNNGLIGVKIKEGIEKIELSFLPKGFYIGMLLSFLALAIILFLLKRYFDDLKSRVL